MFAPSPMVSSWFPSSLPWSLLKKYVCPVLNCWLNLVASCLDDENEIPLKVKASFSASRFALPSIPFNSSPQLGHVCLLVHGFNKVSPFLPFVCTDAVLDGFIQSWQVR